MDRNPGSPAAPNACAKTPVAAQYALPTAEPMRQRRMDILISVLHRTLLVL